MAQKLAFHVKGAFQGPGFAGAKSASKMWFVDGTHGSDGNHGNRPERSVKTVAKAISLASAYDAIHIFDPGFTYTAGSGIDPTPYQETGGANHIIAYTKNNLAIIGCPHMQHNPFSIQLKGDAVATTAIMEVRAPGCAIENLGFNRGASTVGGIYLHDEANDTYGAFGTEVFNCHFKNLRGSLAAATSSGGGIFIYGGWNYLIKDCVFHDCRVGIHGGAGGDNDHKWVRILGCTFDGTTTNRDVDIYYPGGHTEMRIDDCHFGRLPAYAGAGNTARYIILTGVTGSGARNFFGADDTLTFAAAGTGALIPTTFIMAGWWNEGTGCIDRD